MNPKKQAFTLVELIVVITILAILGTIAFISLQGYSATARDSRRISDVNNIETSLELFHLNSGKYPLPDNIGTVSYSGDLLWSQGTVGTNVITSLSRNLANVPTDPLYGMEYTYSVTSSQNQYQLLSLFEGDLSNTTKLINNSYAANTQKVRVDGVYNGLFVKTSNYIVPTPSIITAETLPLDLNTIPLGIKSMVMTNGTNMPNLNRSKIETITGGLDIVLSATGIINSKSTDAEKLSVINAIQAAYTGSILATDDIYKTILSSITDAEKLALVETVVLNTGNVASSQDQGGETPPVVVDLNGNDEYTKLLLHTTTDSSSSNHVPVLYGDVQLKNSNEFSQAANFDGSGDYLDIPDSNDWEFGNGNFTIDFWVKFNDLTLPEDHAMLVTKHDKTNRERGIMLRDLGTPELIFSYSTDGVNSIVVSSAWTPVVSNWYHIAVVRSGLNSTKIFVNGIQLGTTYTTNYTIYSSNNPLRLGADTDAGNYRMFLNGNLDEVRISKGIARRTSNFTPPTTPYTQDVNTDLLLHMEGVNDSTAFVDSSDNQYSVTANGNTKIIGLANEFGDAISFDGAGDYIIIPDSDDWNFGSENFTIDFWVNFDNLTSGYDRLVSQWDSNLSSLNFVTTYNKDTKDLRFSYSADGINITGSKIESWIPLINTWYHVTILRDGNLLKMFVNGTELGSSTDITGISLFNSTGKLVIGTSIISGGGPDINGYLNGYIDEMRISKGIARWAGNFTPPSAPYGN